MRFPLRAVALSLDPALAAAFFFLTVGTVPAVGQSVEAGSITQAEKRVYEAVLDSWLGSRAADQLVNERLDPLPSASDPSNAECVAGKDFQSASGSDDPQKTLSGVTFDRRGLRLVDGDRWRPDDPEDHLANGNVDAAVRQAFAHSLITLSRIAFSRDGRDALVEMHMVCGRLCGTGFTLRMHKVKESWKVAQRCGGYVS